MRRGDVWLINLEPTLGAEIKKTRPAIERRRRNLNLGVPLKRPHRHQKMQRNGETVMVFSGGHRPSQKRCDYKEIVLALLVNPLILFGGRCRI